MSFAVCETPEGRRLRIFRIDRGLRQSDLAAVIGKSQSWVSLVETGRLLAQPEDIVKINSALVAARRHTSLNER